MLDSETKRRIDSARDILVGKVPDPMSQVEQITIALIYKFMDDMDRQSIEMGGKASFFKGEFKKYGWGNIFDPRLGGVEMLNLYGEAITRMSQNANLPELFRNIFKNAYLPYRDPETLKLFLKTINDFTYDHSEKLGDAFEYLLSVLGSQGDAGQFRTPRHIIDFMVQVLDPKKNETVLDPACGTAGFLISAYKHILKSNAEGGMQNAESGAQTKARSTLTAQQKQRIFENFTGYDISPDMVRLSLVNLYLHGFVKPQIHEYDSLASEERWNEYADVILANPPFMSPKGGIMPHKKFSVQSNRSEVLFVDYMAEHLTPNGRAAIIVPEGIIFQSAGAYKQLRKFLIENNFLWAVVSLPAGMFNPYAGVKTSILLLDKSLAKKTDKVLFVKVENDGFDLGAQRRPIDRNDLPKTLKVLKSFGASILDGKAASFAPETDSAFLVSISKLAETGDYNLSADRYREVIRVGKQTYPMVALGDDRYFSIESGGTPDSQNEKYWNGDVYWATLVDLPQDDHISIISDTKRKITQDGLKNSSAKIVPPDSIIVSSRATIGRVGINKVPLATNQGFKNIVIKNRNSADTMFIAFMAKKLAPEMETLASGGTFKEITKTNFSTLQIPLPPLEIQRQLVDEIAAHQRIIDGARQVVEGWKPTFEVNSEWAQLPLGEVITLQRGYDLPKQNWVEGNVPIVGSNGIIGYHNVPKEKGPGVVTGRSGTIGKVHFIDNEYYWPHNTSLFVKEFNGNDRMFVKLLLESLDLKPLGANVASVPSLDRKNAHRLVVSLPPLEIQREIVARIENERAIVHGNRELIRLYEEKVKKVIERVWEG